jgi:hypothetical protein
MAPLLLAFAGVFVASAARADLACANAQELGRVLREKGQLRGARTKFSECARESCPATMQPDCAKALAEIDERMPTVVVHARGASGQELPDVRTLVDGALLAAVSDGTPQPVDPGVHIFQFERDGSARVEQRVVIGEGDKGRVLEVSFAPEPPPSVAPTTAPAPQAHEERNIPIASIALAGLGVVAMGTFFVMALNVRTDVDRMRGTCEPACSASDVSHDKTELAMANVAFGVGVLSLAAATVLYVTRSKPHTDVDVRPTTGGASVVLRHAF